jgi:hypothetical protein
MPRKSIELLRRVARAFVKDMRAFFAEPNAIKRDEIAARQLHTPCVSTARAGCGCLS